MVSFSCEVCNDTIKKPKLDAHKGKCRGAYFTCLDCNTTFNGGEYKGHTTCISEAQKYQGALYKPEKGKGKGKKNGQEANGKPAPDAAPVDEKKPEVVIADVEMADAVSEETSTVVEPVAEKSEDKEVKSMKKDDAAKKEKAKKHKKERKERSKETKSKVAEETKEESEPTEEPTTEPELAKTVEEIPEVEKHSEKKDKKSKKDKKDKKPKKEEPAVAAAPPKVEEIVVETTVVESVTATAAPETATTTKKSEKKEKKSKTDKKRKLDEVVPELTNGATEAPAAETKPEESSPAKKAKKEKLTTEDKALAESFLAIFQKGHPLTLGKAFARLEKEHGADAQKRLLEVIRLKKVKGDLVVSIS